MVPGHSAQRTDQKRALGSKTRSWLSVALRPQETVGLLGTGVQDGHRDFRTAPELCQKHVRCYIIIYSQPTNDGLSELTV